MPAFGMNATKRKGVPRPGSSSGDAGHSATEIGSTMLRSAASGALPATPTVGVAYSTAAYQAMAPLGDATVFEVRPRRRCSIFGSENFELTAY